MAVQLLGMGRDPGVSDQGTAANRGERINRRVAAARGPERSSWPGLYEKGLRASCSTL